MRVRVALLIALLTMFLVAANQPVHAAGTQVLAQEDTSGTDESTEDEGSETDAEGGEGQSDADAETGAGEESAEEPVEEEEGPPWTFQMAKITLALLFLVFLGMGLSYWKLIGSRQRAA